jgi:hypothetical protein
LYTGAVSTPHWIDTGTIPRLDLLLLGETGGSVEQSKQLLNYYIIRAYPPQRGRDRLKKKLRNGSVEQSKQLLNYYIIRAYIHHKEEETDRMKKKLRNGSVEQSKLQTCCGYFVDMKFHSCSRPISSVHGHRFHTTLGLTLAPFPRLDLLLLGEFTVKVNSINFFASNFLKVFCRHEVPFRSRPISSVHGRRFHTTLG